MSAIKDFFKKKKAEAKFKLAGGGQRLGDASQAAARAAPSRPRQQQEQRAHPSQSSQHAGAAALNRLASKERQEVDVTRARQQARIREQARQEIEREAKIDQEVEKIKKTYGEKAEIALEGPGQLATAGVFFRCELVGGEAGTRDEIKQRIREFLYSQLVEEPALTAVLIIHSCNSPRDRVERCVETLCKYVGNIAANPTESKYRKIRVNNKAFSERVAGLEGTREFLEGVGFQLRKMESPEGQYEDFWMFPEENTDLDTLSLMLETLRDTEPVTGELDRNLTVLPPQQKIIHNLPPDFFSVSKEEVAAEQSSKREQLERESMLRTKAMREKEEARAKRKYKYCLMRVRFPDGWVLQGTFSVHEPVSAVLEFVMDCLETPLPHILIDSVTGARLGQADQDTSLLDLGLVPASLVNFCWDPEIEADLASQGNLARVYLKRELKN